MQRTNTEKLLTSAGVIAFAAAAWHLLCIWGGPSWYAFARAPHALIESAQQGTYLAPVATIIVAGLMFTCSAYALCAAGLIRKMPLITAALSTIALICVARALIAVPLLIRSIELDIWQLIASSVWLYVGTCFLLGAKQRINERRELHLELAFYDEFRAQFPVISNKADRAYFQRWNEKLEPLFIYSWFESVAQVINNEMNAQTNATVLMTLFEYLNNQYEVADKLIKHYIDVAIIENLFWQVAPKHAKPYWQVLPATLKTLYSDFHGREPI
ncbi:hypothetical protein [Pseudoalteromonas prydzensis]|jgi:hypothetical protein|uniref:DUF7674 family protein n=1 Tax=Pseudoalteromonas prydzensis TaxID=182141 RepID=UPI0037049C25